MCDYELDVYDMVIYLCSERVKCLFVSCLWISIIVRLWVCCWGYCGLFW